MGVRTLSQHNWAIKRLEHEVVLTELLAHASGRLVDVGCGTKPYAKALRGRVDEHVGIDHEESPHGTGSVDRIGTAYATGEPDASAQTVLLSQVLEHLEEPAAALREAHRILAPGGVLVLSTNFAWHLHEEPRDFFRYSPYGLRHLFEQAGFQVQTVRAVAGTWFVLFQEAAYAVRRAARRRRLVVALSLPLTHLLQVLALAGQRVSRDEGLASGHVVVARRP